MLSPPRRASPELAFDGREILAHVAARNRPLIARNSFHDTAAIERIYDERALLPGRRFVTYFCRWSHLRVMESLDRRVSMIDERLVEVLADLQPPALSQAIDHAALAGGKRVRPTVTLLTCEVVGGDPADAVDFGVGIELVHTATLVVDDIIDRSSIRRGVESTWARFGYAPAIIASDGILGEAFALFSREPRAMGIVAEALVELGEGEAIELVDPPTDETEYRELARRKTGSLFRAAAALGAVAAGANAVTVEAVGEYAERVGIAFQIRDDVLDATAEPDVLGKPTGHDAEMDRPSFIQVTDLSVAEANERARTEADAAISALSRIDDLDPTARAYLHDLAAFVVARER